MATSNQVAKLRNCERTNQVKIRNSAKTEQKAERASNVYTYTEPMI